MDLRCFCRLSQVCGFLLQRRARGLQGGDGATSRPQREVQERSEEEKRRLKRIQATSEMFLLHLAASSGVKYKSNFVRLLINLGSNRVFEVTSLRLDGTWKIALPCLFVSSFKKKPNPGA